MGYTPAGQVAESVVVPEADGTVVVVGDVAAAAVAAGVATVGHNHSSRIKHYVLVAAWEEAEVLPIVDCNRQQVVEHVVVAPEPPNNYSLVVLAEVVVVLGVKEAAGV